MSDGTQDLEERTEEQIVVREVTHLQASWAERDRAMFDRGRKVLMFRDISLT